MRKRRVFFLAILLLLLVMLFGLVYVYLSLDRGDATVDPVDVGPGLKHIRSIYGYGEEADSLLSQPYGVAYRDGLLYVGQIAKGIVVVFDDKGGYVRSVGTQGRGVGELNSPGGVDVDGLGNVYVADTQHAKIVVYDAQGEFVTEIAVERPLIPRVVDDLRLYVAAFDSIKVFDIPGYKELSSWGRRGREEAEFDFPNGLVVADEGESVFVADGNNMRLKRLDKNGEKVWIVGAAPADIQDADRLFGLPGGMALVDDILYIVDPLNSVIHLYRTDGTKVGEVGDVGGEEGQFSYPSQIASMGGNRFAITEWGNDRVQIVEIDPQAVAAAVAVPEVAPSTGE
ncbi:MAG: 6-bladed beta-propeller [Thermoleophilia bacterium]